MPVGIRFEVQHFGFQQHLVKKNFYILARFGRNFLCLVFPSPFLDKDVHLGKVFPELVGVGIGLVYFIEGEHNRYSGCHSVVNGFLGPGHYRFISSDHDDGHIRHTGSACTHCSKRFMTGSIKESYGFPVFKYNFICTYMLGDSAGFTCHDIGGTYKIEKLGLPVVNMAHDRNDRCTVGEILRTIISTLSMNGLLYFNTDKLNLIAEFIRDKGQGFSIKSLID